MHASQLWVRSGLFLVDAWARQYYSEEYRFKYFATLSKISHLWRENAVAIYRLFREEFDACTAVMFGSKIPSRCIAGRWQSCHATEKNILEVGPERLTTVFNLLCSRTRKIAAKPDVLPLQSGEFEPAKPNAEDKPQAATSKDDAEDLDPMNESVAQHRRRMGQWRTDVEKAVNDSMFWSVLKIHTRVNEVVQHFFNFLAEDYSEADLVTDGNQCSRLLGASNKRLFLADHVFQSKGEQFMFEYERLLMRPGVFGLLDKPAFQISSSHGVYAGKANALTNLAVLLTLHHAVNFENRVMMTINKFPHRLVLFTKRPPDESCSVRQGQLLRGRGVGWVSDIGTASFNIRPRFDISLALHGSEDKWP